MINADLSGLIVRRCRGPAEAELGPHDQLS
jgi:hypothetical protein